MIAVSVGWQMYDLTHSALALGLVGLAQFAPLLALMLVVGPVIDRYDRRTIARAAQALESAAVAVLCLATLAQSFRLTLAPGAKVEPVSRLSLRPGERLPMILVPRAPAAHATAPKRAIEGCPVDHG